MKNLAIIQARVSSTRLPNKVMLKLEDKTVLEHVIYRVKRSKLVTDVTVATSSNKKDSEIVSLCADIGIRVFCGSEDDVLDRYYRAAKQLSPDHITRITSDCPLIDPAVIDLVVGRHLKEDVDYTSNTIKPTFPDGVDVEIFTFKALEKAWENANLASEREHVTPYIRKHTEIFKTINVEYDRDLSDKRWTLDNKEDYEFIACLYKNLYEKDQSFGLSETLQLLSKHPEFEQINKHITRNEGYEKSLKEDRVLDIKHLKK